jgi:trimeric autotransporter adhesin
MTTALRSTITVFLLLVLSSAAFAQEQSSAGTASPLVTATASAGRVRYVSMGEVQQTRLQVFSPEGVQIFDSSYRDGNLIDWQLTDQQGSRVKDGSYIFLVTVKDFSGRSTQKFGTAVMEQEQVYLEQTRRSALSPAQTTALDASKESEALSPVDRVGAAELNRTATLTTSTGNTSQSTQASGNTEQTLTTSGTTSLAGTGTQNKLSKWTDNTGTLGNSNIFEDANGRIGIGTTNPLSEFHIVGNGGASAITLNTPGIQKFRFQTVPNIPNWGAFTMNANYNSGWYLDDPNTNGWFFKLDTRGGNAAGDANGLWLWRVPQGAGAHTNEYPVFGITNGRAYFSENVGIGTLNPQGKLDVNGNLKISGPGSGLIFPDGSIMTTAYGSNLSGNNVITAINSPSTTMTIADNRLPGSLARLSGANFWTGSNAFANGLSANNSLITNVGNPVNAGDAVNKAYADASFIKFTPAAEQLSVGDANGAAPMINLRGGSTCCSGPGGHTPAWFKVFQNGSFVATGNLGIGVSPMQGKGYRTSWDSYKGAFRSGYADNEWDDATVGFFSWAGGSNSTAEGLYALAFGDTNFARSTSSIAFGSGNEVKGAAGFSAGAGNRVCGVYGVALGNNARSGGPYINSKCDPDTFNIRGRAAVAIGYYVTADQDHTLALGKFASNNGWEGTFIWSDGSATASADTFRNTANNEFAARATGGFRFRTNLGGTTGCNLPAGSGVFNCTSSRATKENFLKISGEEVLTKLRDVPISSWNYISEGQQVRHIGPMAEDFYQAFGLGTGNTSIGVQDLAGVNLAAVKALDERTDELQKKTLELQQKTAEVEQLRGRVNLLEERLANIERAMQESRSAKGLEAK